MARVQHDGSEEVLFCVLPIPFIPHSDRAHRGVCFSQTIVDRKCPHSGCPGLCQASAGISSPQETAAMWSVLARMKVLDIHSCDPRALPNPSSTRFVVLPNPSLSSSTT